MLRSLARAPNRLPHDEAVHAARPELRVGAAVEQIRRRGVPYEVQRRVHPPARVDRGDDLTRAALLAGVVEAVGQVVVERRGQALPVEEHPVDPQDVVEADIRTDLHRLLGAANPTTDVAADLGPELVRVGEVVEPVGVADRGVEARPVEGQPVRHRGREAAPVGVVRRQLLDQLAHQLALDPELRRVLPRRRPQPRPDEPGQRGLREDGEPELPLAHVGQPRDELALPFDDHLAPTARGDGVQPPGLLERGVCPTRLVVGRRVLACWLRAAHP